MLEVKPIDARLSFGVRIGGVTLDALKDAAVRRQINELFEDKGVIVFENIEPTGEMHVALSTVFGPLKEHPSPAIKRAQENQYPGIVYNIHEPNERGVCEVDGRLLSMWLPWHFDHCYNNELNRGGILRCLDVPAEGGMTGFVDGIDLYNTISQKLLAQIEDKNIIYRLNVVLGDMRFGRPANLVELSTKPRTEEVMAAAKGKPRAIHPAVWTRKSGEKVLHVSPWMAEGIEDMEDPSGDALLEAVSQEINALSKTRSYFHRWRLTDMVIWDNWRVLHSVSGSPPQYGRQMQRTTIQGDYGLGRFEHDGKADKVLEMSF